MTHVLYLNCVYRSVIGIEMRGRGILSPSVAPPARHLELSLAAFVIGSPVHSVDRFYELLVYCNSGSALEGSLHFLTQMDRVRGRILLLLDCQSIQKLQGTACDEQCIHVI
jgi:hypothetical protein